MGRDRDIVKTSLSIDLKEIAMLNEEVKDALDIKQGHGTLLYAHV